jgi:hypothetical protein
MFVAVDVNVFRLLPAVVGVVVFGVDGHGWGSLERCCSARPGYRNIHYVCESAKVSH